MNQIPANPKIYHITHFRNVRQIIEQGVLWSDAKRIELGLDCEVLVRLYRALDQVGEWNQNTVRTESLLACPVGKEKNVHEQSREKPG